MADDEALFQKGMPIRREVLGAEYVDASMARADEFMMSFQRATTAWAWGWAWGDTTLDRKTRSLINLAMLTALNRAPEIKLHVKGALNNGVHCCTRRPIAGSRPGSTRSARPTRFWSARERSARKDKFFFGGTALTSRRAAGSWCSADRYIHRRITRQPDAAVL